MKRSPHLSRESLVALSRYRRRCPTAQKREDNWKMICERVADEQEALRLEAELEAANNETIRGCATRESPASKRRSGWSRASRAGALGVAFAAGLLLLFRWVHVGAVASLDTMRTVYEQAPDAARSPRPIGTKVGTPGTPLSKASTPPQRDRGAARVRVRPLTTATFSDPRSGTQLESQAPARTSLGEEIRHLRTARSALTEGNLREALRAASRYRKRFPDGVFIEEALAIEASVSCRLGCEIQSAEVFSHRFPRSPHRARVTRACGACRDIQRASVGQ